MAAERDAERPEGLQTERSYKLGDSTISLMSMTYPDRLGGGTSFGWHADCDLCGEHNAWVEKESEAVEAAREHVCKEEA
jgi:hypothetical protein